MESYTVRVEFDAPISEDVADAILEDLRMRGLDSAVVHADTEGRIGVTLSDGTGAGLLPDVNRMMQGAVGHTLGVVSIVAAAMGDKVPNLRAVVVMPSDEFDRTAGLVDA